MPLVLRSTKTHPVWGNGLRSTDQKRKHKATNEKTEEIRITKEKQIGQSVTNSYLSPCRAILYVCAPIHAIAVYFLFYLCSKARLDSKYLVYCPCEGFDSDNSENTYADLQVHGRQYFLRKRDRLPSTVSKYSLKVYGVLPGTLFVPCQAFLSAESLLSLALSSVASPYI
jgi:hypothetical protein